MIVILVKKIRNMPFIVNCLKVSILLIFLITSSFYVLLRNKYVSELQFNNQKVTISRDQHNIPHIQAPTYSQLMYAWGYVLAEDRLFQMAFRRAMLQGRLSQYTGQKSLIYDKLFRQLGLHHWGDKIANKLQQQDKQQYQNFLNFAKGINTFVQNLLMLPIDFQLLGLDWQEWTVGDIFTVFKAVQWSQAMNGPQQLIRSQLLQSNSYQEVTKLMPASRKQYYPSKSIVSEQELQQSLKKSRQIQNVKRFTPTQIQQLIAVGMASFSSSFGSGSNSWVISGNYTKTGKPIVANDPHLHSALPGEWYQIEVTYFKGNKKINMIGGSMVGLPIIVGKSQYAAFAFTSMHGDTIDWYRQSINLQDQTYQLNGKQIPLKKRVQKIKVQGEQDLEYIVYETHRGPIVHYVQHYYTFYNTPEYLSYAWTGYQNQYMSLVAYCHIGECFDIQCIHSQLIDRSDYGPAMNLLYGTQDNHIGYCQIGPQPLRRRPQDGTWVKDGKTDQQDWIGMIRGRQKLRLIDPAKGYIITANNIPGPESYQNDLFGTSTYTARYQRIEHLIMQKRDRNELMTTQDMMPMQLDTKDAFCYMFLLRALFELLPKQNLLKNFTCDMASQSYQASIYENFFYQYYLIKRPNDIHNIANSHHFIQYMFRSIFFAQKGSQTQSKVNQAYNNALKALQKSFGTSDHTQWKWGKIHQQRMIHRPFSQSSILKNLYQRNLPGKGNMHTPNVGFMNRLSKGDFGNYHKANLRLIMGFNEKSYWVIDGGSSQKFYSKFYDDQLKLQTEGKYIVMQHYKEKTQDDDNKTVKSSQL